jgi:hypothetical protein
MRTPGLFTNTSVCVLPADFFGSLPKIFQINKNLRLYTVLCKVQVRRNKPMLILRAAESSYVDLAADIRDVLLEVIGF